MSQPANEADGVNVALYLDNDVIAWLRNVAEDACTTPEVVAQVLVALKVREYPQEVVTQNFAVEITGEAPSFDVPEGASP